MIEEKYERKEGYWISDLCINWHHLDCRVARCECNCHSMKTIDEDLK